MTNPRQTNTEILDYWNNLTLVGFDIESTGTDIETDRIVTATLLLCRPGQTPLEATWVVDPGIDIPDEAAAVHGWTTERVKNHPGTVQPAQALPEIGMALERHLSTRTPVVAYNATYDFSIFDRELARHHLPAINPSHGHGIAPIIDPRVLDKHLDPYRPNDCARGTARRPPCNCGATDRTLVGMTKHYGVQLTEADAHTSAGDALAAVGAARAIIREHVGRFRGYTVEGLHDAQVAWWRKAMIDFERWNQEKNGGAYTDIRPEWPLIPRPAAADPSLQGALL